MRCFQGGFAELGQGAHHAQRPHVPVFQFRNQVVGLHLGVVEDLLDEAHRPGGNAPFVQQGQPLAGGTLQEGLLRLPDQLLAVGRRRLAAGVIIGVKAYVRLAPAYPAGLCRSGSLRQPREITPSAVW